jgi:hypothetical protein
MTFELVRPVEHIPAASSRMSAGRSFAEVKQPGIIGVSPLSKQVEAYHRNACWIPPPPYSWWLLGIVLYLPSSALSGEDEFQVCFSIMNEVI